MPSTLYEFGKDIASSGVKAAHKVRGAGAAHPRYHLYTYMKRDGHKNSVYKPQPYTTIIPSFVSLRLYLIKKNCK